MVRAYGGRLFELDRHLGRLERSLHALRVRGVAPSRIGPVLQELLVRNGLERSDALVYLQVTRGSAPRTHRFPDPAVEPTMYGYAWAYPAAGEPEEGVRAITVPDQRWARCDIKMTSLLGNVMANQYAMEHGCYETLFVRNGVFTEASHCNVFFVKEGAVYTHPANEFILDGITRQVVRECCRKLGIARYLTKPLVQSDLLDTILRLETHTTLVDATTETYVLARSDRRPRLKILLAEGLTQVDPAAQEPRERKMP